MLSACARENQYRWGKEQVHSHLHLMRKKINENSFHEIGKKHQD